MIRFACPYCQKVLAAPEERAGARTTCPGCRQLVEVPQPVAEPIQAVPTVLPASAVPAAAMPASPFEPPMAAAIAEPAQPRSKTRRRLALVGALAALTFAGCLLAPVVWLLAKPGATTEPQSVAATAPARTSASVPAKTSSVPAKTSTLPDKSPAVVDAGPPAETPPSGEQPYLMLDADGHSADVTRVALTPDNRYVVTASMDKTVRVWDVATGETIRTIRLWLDAGLDGLVFSLAMSPDGKTLALGGSHRLEAQKNKGYLIFLVNLQSGKVDRVLKGHGNTIASLAFSRDGKRLASGGGDKALAIWDLATGKNVNVLLDNPTTINDVVFSADGQRVLSHCEDGTTRIWSIATGAAEVSFASEQMITSIAWSPDGKTIATGHSAGMISLWEPDGKLRRQVSGLRNKMLSLSFSPDSRELLFTGAGFGPGNNENGCSIVDLAAGKERLRVPLHSNTVRQGAISADGKLAVSSGGNAYETFVWRVADGSVVNQFVGKAKVIWGVGWTLDGQSIGWGTIRPTLREAMRAKLERTFHLSELQFGASLPTNMARGDGRLGKRVLALTEENHLVLIDVEQKKVLRQYKPADARDRVWAYTWLPDGRAVICQTYRMFLWDPDTGKVLREFSGHNGTVHGIAPSPTGRYFLTGGGDQTVRIWDPEHSQPILSLFFTEQDWVAWTEDGVYAASPGGERLIGWHINHGTEQAGSFYPAAQFRASLYHPEIIRHINSAGSIKVACERAGKPYARGLNVSSVLPPVVNITAPVGLGSVPVEQGRFEVKASAKSAGKHPVTRLQLLVNGRPYGGQAGIKTIDQPRLGELQLSWNVDLPPGLHLLSVLAESAVSRALSPVVEVTVAGQSAGPPNLYVLAVGIDDYPGGMKLDYAASDADAIVRIFQQQQGKLYGKVEAKVIKDKQATRLEIEKGLAWLGSKMTPRDVGVVCFSGHGDRDDSGNFFLIPVDVNLKNVPGTCVSGDLLKTRLRDMPGRLIAMLDACHSGAAGERKRRVGMTDDLVRDLISEDYGIVVMSSSRGHEVSIESPTVQHGFFTLAVVEGLEGKADSNRDGLVYLTEIDNYTLRRVRELSDGAQTPVMARPRTIRSFPLSKP
jgi:WD40 repeat protein